MTTQLKQKQNQNQNKNPLFIVGSSVQVKSNSSFSEKSDKNKIIYYTYIGKKGTIVSIPHNNGKDITYIVEMISNKGKTFTFDILEKYLEEFVQDSSEKNDMEGFFKKNDKVFVKNDADFSEKSIENKKSYETYKNREGTVIQLKHKNKNSDNSTYIIEMNSTTNIDKKFTFDILGKYLTSII